MLPDKSTAMLCDSVIFSSSLTIILRAMCVIVQNKNKMVKALDRADKALIIIATLAVLLPAKSEKKRANIKNSGAPGGCPTSNLKAVAINSPQSQKLVVGSIVSK